MKKHEEELGRGVGMDEELEEEEEEEEEKNEEKEKKASIPARRARLKAAGVDSRPSVTVRQSKADWACLYQTTAPAPLILINIAWKILIIFEKSAYASTLLFHCPALPLLCCCRVNVW
ncbi:hypothetical protein ACOMHN_059742 [Nucella lapillus]